MNYFDLALISAALLVVVLGGDPIVRTVLLVAEKGMTTQLKRQLERESIPNAGRFIGYLERALVFMLVMSHQSGSIAFIIAAKAIIRFESAKHRPFAEYFLIGTFTSILIAVVVASLLLVSPISWR